MNTLIAVLLLLTVLRLGYSVETHSSGQSSVSVEEYSSSNDSTYSSEKDESVSVEEYSSSYDSTYSSEKDESVSVEEHSSSHDSTYSSEKDESVSVEEYSSSNDSTYSSEKDESVSVEEYSSSHDSTYSSEKDESVSVEEYSSSHDSTDSSEKDESVSVKEHSSSNDSSDSSEEDDIDYEDTIIYAESIPDCGNDTNMNATIRMAAYSLHIVLRGDLANGQVKNGNRTEAKNFSSASDMSLLVTTILFSKYDCGLEQSAFNISKMCRHESDLNFSNVGSNSAFYAGKIDDVHQLIHELIYGWWNTSMQSFPLSKATPTASDSGMIPFLQMANANTTKIGCAYSECSSGRDGCDDSSSSIVLVCSYGTAHIQPNTPIYTEGRPCDTCNNTCAYKSLCNRTMSELECH
ncbi:hypothetical protein KIN20_013382 [Parelaphostrongylus tenuis]|uniref:SCP domain-containing protein n=1 Tax=Parelaphostrongylus tenuis TaxID=148309 RepID=A0AAD5QL02_PARTN|nr:hypothetical protein KIN20_013382 [Parelaphostrongylus tenuis]